MRSFVKRLPLIGPCITRAYRRVRSVCMPGLTVKQRVRLLPLIGPVAAWIYAILHLNAIRQQITRELTELRQLQRNNHIEASRRLDQFDVFHLEGTHQLRELNSLKISHRFRHLDSLDIANRLEQLDALRNEFQALNIIHRLAQLEASNASPRLTGIERAMEALQAGNVERDNRIAALVREVRHSQNTACIAPPALATDNAATNATAAAGFDMDSFYVEFEGLFRGSREDIQNRLKVYLPYLESFAGDSSARVVDVGCGRGEWLELLKERGMDALGIDLNSEMVQSCRERGLAAEYGDAIHYLRQQPEGSLAAVTGFHIIEHLPFEALIALMDAALRALRDDGLIIFETPNPENVLVGSCNFYFDPTHQRPIVPVVVEFMARQRGFARAEILRLHPYETMHHVQDGSEAARRMNALFYGAQDFALLAWKTRSK